MRYFLEGYISYPVTFHSRKSRGARQAREARATKRTLRGKHKPPESLLLQHWKHTSHTRPRVCGLPCEINVLWLVWLHSSKSPHYQKTDHHSVPPLRSAVPQGAPFPTAGPFRPAPHWHCCVHKRGWGRKRRHSRPVLPNSNNNQRPNGVLHASPGFKMYATNHAV